MESSESVGHAHKPQEWPIKDSRGLHLMVLHPSGGSEHATAWCWCSKMPGETGGFGGTTEEHKMFWGRLDCTQCSGRGHL